VTVSTRRAREEDGPAVLALLRDSLGKDADPRYDDFFRWKHTDNPFGISPAWVAEEGGAVVGFRTFMRWQFRSGGEVVRAVRAVDTATARSARGRGIFQRLTTEALDELVDEGVRLVFNTPNDQSRPGYLKMGWRVVGRMPVSVQVRGPASAARMAAARRPAALWSIPTSVGRPVATATNELLTLSRPGAGFGTDRSAPYLVWRYGFGPLAYRAATSDDAAMVFRLRRRGRAVELAACEAHGSSRGIRRLVRHVLRSTGADYAIRIGSGGLPLPGQGPILTCRPLGSAQQPNRWDLDLGDVELF
jgi:GNAT superfamily N-acetyltransferase